jgi:hypothetical protein
MPLPTKKERYEYRKTDRLHLMPKQLFSLMASRRQTNHHPSGEGSDYGFETDALGENAESNNHEKRETYG